MAHAHRAAIAIADENDDELSLMFYGKLSILPFNLLFSFFIIIEVRIIIISYFLIVGL